MSYEQPVPDERMLEIIKERLDPGFRRTHDPEDITKEQLILELIRQAEWGAYGYGILEMRTKLRMIMGYDIPDFGWREIPDFKQ